MAHYGKLLFVAAQKDETNMDLLVYAQDFLHAVRLWKLRYSGWDWPDKVKVFTMPACRDQDGVVDWSSLTNIEIAPKDIV